MKMVFAGSPEFAVPVLEALIAAKKEVVAVVTQPDRPVGRKHVLTPTPVKRCAQEHGIPVYDFERIRDHAEQLQAIGADIMITCAYGQMLPQSVLNCFRGGVWNLHASLLPEFRGASPIQSAILAGKTHTGITVMKTELAMDTGDMLLVKRTAVGDKTYGELEEELSHLAASAALEAVALLESGQTQLLMQDEARATYCKKIEKEDARIDFNRPAEEVVHLIRAMSPRPLAWCRLNGGVLNVFNAALSDSVAEGKAGEVVELNAKAQNGRGERVGAVTVKCGAGAVDIFALIPAGGKLMFAKDFINGRKIKAGDLLE